MSGLAVIRGIVAVELKVPGRPGTVYLERAQAQGLSLALSGELARHLGSLDGLGLVLMAAVYDSAQLLRPGFPVHSELENLYQAGIRDPLAEPQVMTLTALRGAPPSAALAPDPELLGGPFLALPFSILGPAEVIEPARNTLEACLFEQGLVDARLALNLRDALDLDLEHVRLMTLTDLCAMTAAQLQHVGLGAVWELLEDCLVSAPLAQQWRLDSGVEFGRRGPDQVWLRYVGWRQLDPGARDPDAHADRVLHTRQTLALLDAHGIALEMGCESSAQQVEFDESVDAGYLIEWWQPGESVRQLRGYTLPRIGIVEIGLIGEDGAEVGRAHPLQADSLNALLRRLRDRGGDLDFELAELA
ncbi:MAG: hypothetical protein MUE46_00965 [Xanthomonadales bacterium]|jgi:hypothetical protein|nr:hypothetical protein [Xanthomonadales bacterium]